MTTINHHWPSTIIIWLVTSFQEGLKKSGIRCLTILWAWIVSHHLPWIARLQTTAWPHGHCVQTDPCDLPINWSNEECNLQRPSTGSQRILASLCCYMIHTWCSCIRLLYIPANNRIVSSCTAYERIAIQWYIIDSTHFMCHYLPNVTFVEDLQTNNVVMEEHACHSVDGSFENS